MTYENRPEKDTPDSIREMLADYGGLLLDGRPVWRMVLAKNVRIQATGIMAHAPKVTAAMSLDATKVQAERMEEGTFWVPRYKGVEGWILERWMPPQAWGTRAEWDADKADDGVRKLRGAYPENGDYWKMAGPWPSIEQAGDLRAAIQAVNRMKASAPKNWDLCIHTELALERLAREEQIRNFETELEAYRKHHLLPVLQSTSAAAHRVRAETQRAIGNNAHVGASAAWN